MKTWLADWRRRRAVARARRVRIRAHRRYAEELELLRSTWEDER